MRVVVLGAGGVGAGIGGLLVRAGVETVLIARGAHAAVMAASGLTLRTPSVSHHIPVTVQTTPAGVDWRPGDVVLLATKVGDTAAALDALLAAAGPGVPVVVAQNGLDGVRQARARCETVIPMMVWMPAVFLKPGVVELHGQPPGVLEVGGAGPASEVVSALTSAGFVSRVHPDIHAAIHGKLLTNLGGVVQALAGQDPGCMDVARAALEEGEGILSAAGWRFEAPDALRARCMAAVKMGTINGQRRPGGSTWQSAVRGRPLESVWLNGEIVSLAASIGRDAPINRRLVDLSRTPPAEAGSLPAASLLP